MNGASRSRPRDIEQASALLDVVNEAQLHTFLRRLLDGAARRAGRPPPTRRMNAVLAVAKSAALQTLPTLAALVDPTTGPPAAAVSPVATAARVYGLELEGLSAEDRDFEVARQFVRFVDDAATRASEPLRGLSDTEAVDEAVTAAARSFAPGLLSTPWPPQTSDGSAPWMRAASGSCP